MSTIAVVGATGFAGGHITAEALRRGHQVIGVSRHAPSESVDGVTSRTGDITDEAFIRDLAQQASTMVVAVHGSNEGEPYLAALVESLLEAALAGSSRLGFVGGVGSLAIALGGPRLVDTAGCPEIYKVEALSHVAVLEALRGSNSSADWFYVSPAANFGARQPGERTGSYRTGGDVLLSDDDGVSFISGADLAVAFLDEIEVPAHHRERFSVAY
jgi:putative NADH-flavin reductase